jgi:anti-anti-sigma factor
MGDSFLIREVNTREPARVIRIAGRLDARAAAQLASHCQDLCDPGRPLVLVLDEVEFLSSSGVGTLLALVEEFRESGASLLLARPSEAVSLAVKLLNLDEFLTLHESEEDALRREAA